MNVCCPKRNKCVWEGLIKRDSCKKTNHVIATPKRVILSLFQPFNFGIGAVLDCTVAALVNRGFGVGEKGFGTSIDREKVARGWIARREHTLEHSIMESINRDVFLTFLLINDLHRFKKGGETHFVPNDKVEEVWTVLMDCGEIKHKKLLKRAVWRGNGRGLSKDDLEQESLNKGAVWMEEEDLTTYPLQNLNASGENTSFLKKHWLQGDKEWLENLKSKTREMAWNKEGEVSKWNDEGGLVLEVLGIGGPLELRTILFQEGEDDPNRISLKSDLEHGRKLMSRLEEVARKRGRFGCGEVHGNMGRCKDDANAKDTPSECLLAAMWRGDVADDLAGEMRSFVSMLASG